MTYEARGVLYPLYLYTSFASRSVKKGIFLLMYKLILLNMLVANNILMLRPGLLRPGHPSGSTGWLVISSNTNKR